MHKKDPKKIHWGNPQYSVFNRARQTFDVKENLVFFWDNFGLNSVQKSRKGKPTNLLNKSHSTNDKKNLWSFQVLQRVYVLLNEWQTRESERERECGKCKSCIKYRFHFRLLLLSKTKSTTTKILFLNSKKDWGVCVFGPQMLCWAGVELNTTIKSRGGVDSVDLNQPLYGIYGIEKLVYPDFLHWSVWY